MPSIYWLLLAEGHLNRRHAAEDLGAAAAERVTLRDRGSIDFDSKTFRREQCRTERRSARSINVLLAEGQALAPYWQK